MSFVVAAYGLTVLLLGGYAVSIVVRWRRVLAQQQWAERSGEAEGRDSTF